MIRRIICTIPHARWRIAFMLSFIVPEVPRTASPARDKRGRGLHDRPYTFRPSSKLPLRKVPREAFLPERLREFAYEDSPLPIDAGQTISQPYIVALMTEALEDRSTFTRRSPQCRPAIMALPASPKLSSCAFHYVI